MLRAHLAWSGSGTLASPNLSDLRLCDVDQVPDTDRDDHQHVFLIVCHEVFRRWFRHDGVSAGWPFSTLAFSIRVSEAVSMPI